MLARLKVLAVLAAFVPLLGPPGASATVGPTNVGTAVDTNDPGRAQDYRVSSSATGAVNRLNVYLDASNSASMVELGLYDNQTPHQLLGRCVIETPNPGVWNRCAISPVNVTQGTNNYWTSILQPTGSIGTLRYRNKTGSGQNFWSSSDTLTQLPATWTNGNGWGAQVATINADLGPAAPTAAFTFSPAAPVQGEAVQFDATTSSCAAMPCTYTWEDDGVDGPGGVQSPLGSGAMLNLAFEDAGSKHVRLTVVDAIGQTGTVMQNVEVGEAPSSCTAHATPADLAATFAAANGGDTICLATGDYTGANRFTGGLKAGMVTLKPEDGATPLVEARFNPAANITLDGVKLYDFFLTNSQSHDIVVRNSDFDQSGARLVTAVLENADVLFEGNTHIGWEACEACGEGRITLAGNTGTGVPSGVTIRDSYFAQGNSDGVLNGGANVVIEGNTFVDIHQIDGPEGVHADSIQLYGSMGTEVRGNFFYDVADCIMAADGGDHEVIEDNVCVTDGYPWGFSLQEHDGTIVRHNTLAAFSTTTVGETCVFGLKCGSLRTHEGTNITIKDNIAAWIDPAGSTPNTFVEEDFNLLTAFNGAGANDELGTPTYVGGSAPNSYAGFKLASGSNGQGDASDGADRGARIP